MSKLRCCIWFLALVSSYTQVTCSTSSNPFTPKAFLIRYWNMKISNPQLQKPPEFLLSKASPLNSIDYAFLNKLASQHKLSTHLSTFCSSANLFCEFDSITTTIDHPTHQDSNFSSYSSSKDFTNYGSSRHGGAESFKNYSVGINMPTNTFTHYSPTSTSHRESFTSYSNNANVGDDQFTTYATRTTGGSGEFTQYETNVNVPNLRFSSYDSRSDHHPLTFTSYTPEANSGKETFVSYGKNANNNNNNSALGFTEYGDTTNILSSTFTGYSEMSNGGANDSFKGYAANGNNPNNDFKSYNVGGKFGTDSFTSYRDGANVGEDSFQVYGRGGESVKSRFVNYGKSFNEGTDTFNEYVGHRRDVGFMTYYGMNNTFKGYGDDEKGIKFAGYAKTKPHDHTKKKFRVEEGKFFRESMLKTGTVFKMPDIRDKMPIRSFLPRSIHTNLPSSITNLSTLFHTNPNSTTSNLFRHTLDECHRAPSRGETKQCVGSIEDMIDFAVSVLGRNDVVVRTTESVGGSGQKVLIGSVTDEGRVTRSAVSCHQSLLPYLFYYCHSVPKVRVYEADILGIDTKLRINHGIAICHLDTSDWSSGHAAFLALGSKPGSIEVCHWIFQNDMTWTT